MNPDLIHPALLKLLRYQAIARFRKLLDSFRSPRRQLVSLLAIVLALVWLGQAIAGILFREAADPERLAVWIPLGFVAYTAWHLVKTISSKPMEPFEWTPAELELLCGAPLKRRHLVVYRFASIVSSAILKSICFTLLMMPDLKILVAGFLGMLAGLILVDLFRVIIEQGCQLLSRAGLWVARGVVYIVLTVWVASSFWFCIGSSSAASDLASPGAFLFAKRLGQSLVEQITTYGTLLLLPFQSSVDAILASKYDFALLIDLCIGFGLVIGLMKLVLVLDLQFLKIQRRRESLVITANANKRQDFSDDQSRQLTSRIQKMRVPVRLRGIGSIAWRQLLGAWHYRGTLGVSLGIPVLLCCLPLLAPHEPLLMLLNIVAGLVFYSFLLLPPALMLDFRRDIHRIDVLKSLPIKPMAVTAGQLATPVLMCMMFQWIVLLIAALCGSVLFWQAAIAALLLIPVSVLIFAVENVLFMMAPYRRNQEGLSVFVRTILTFTAKGLMFALAMVVTIAWAWICRQLAANDFSSQLLSGILFGGGIWLMTSLAAASMTFWLAKIYRDFDPSLDAPGIS